MYILQASFQLLQILGRKNVEAGKVGARVGEGGGRGDQITPLVHARVSVNTSNACSVPKHSEN